MAVQKRADLDILSTAVHVTVGRKQNGVAIMYGSSDDINVNIGKQLP